MSIRKNIDVCNLAETLAEDHIRLAIAHIKSYLATWWMDEHFNKKHKALEKIINQLEELIQ